LEYDRGRRPSTKKYYPEPHHPSVSLMDVQKDFGENEKDKDNQHGVELALLGFDCQVANRPLLPHDQPVVLCSNIEFERYWFGVLPLHVGYLFKTGYYKEPEASPTRTSLRFKDERGGFKVAKVNLPLPDGRLRLFLEGKEDRLEEGLLVPAKKNKREGL
jgi:hypothetical protein